MGGGSARVLDLGCGKALTSIFMAREYGVRVCAMADGWREWLLWEEVCRDAGAGHSPEEIEMLRADAGRHLGFVRVVARKR